MVWNNKSCPRCGGNTYIEEEVGQLYEKCLQCGYERALEKVSLKPMPVLGGKQTVREYAGS